MTEKKIDVFKKQNWETCREGKHIEQSYSAYGGFALGFEPQIPNSELLLSVTPRIYSLPSYSTLEHFSYWLVSRIKWLCNPGSLTVLALSTSHPDSPRPFP